MVSLMNKLKNITDLNELSDTDIDLIFGHDIVSRSDDTNNGNVSKKCNMSSALTTCKINTDECGCRACGTSDFIIHDSTAGIIVCSKCGHIIESNTFDHAPEWKNHDDGTPQNDRCGLPTNNLLPQLSMSTMIIGKCDFKMKNSQKWDIMPYRERSLNNVLVNIKKKCDTAELKGCIMNDAQILYKITSEYKNDTTKNLLIIRGKNRIGLMSACVFYACKRNGYTKSLKEIATMFNISTSCVNKGCKNFCKFVKSKKIDYSINLCHPSQYIKNFCDKMNLVPKVVDFIIKIADNVQIMNIATSHTPISVAAACVLLGITHFSIKEIDKDIISNIFDISCVTIMKAYNKINNHIKTVLLDKEQILAKKNIKITRPKKFTKLLEQIKNIDTSKYPNFSELDIRKNLSVNVAKHNVEMCKFMKTGLNEMDRILSTL